MEEVTMDERAEADLGQLLENRYYRNDPLERNIILGEITLEHAEPGKTSFNWDDSKGYLEGQGFIVDELGEEDFKVRGADLEVFYNRIQGGNAEWAASVNYWKNIPSEPLHRRDSALIGHLKDKFRSAKTGDYRGPEDW